MRGDIFYVGDTVFIADSLDECEYGANSKMWRLRGLKATITRAPGYLSDMYEIDLDNGDYIWDSSCFCRTEEEELHPPTDEDIFGFLGL